FDGPSVDVLFGELAALYAAYSAGRPAALAELPVQYGDFALWQRRWMSPEMLQGHMAYWTRHLAGVAELRLPSDRPRTEQPGSRAHCESVTLPPDLSDELK